MGDFVVALIFDDNNKQEAEKHIHRKMLVSPSDHKSTGGHCFRQRTPTGHRGQCTDKIRPSENSTVSDANECCLQGGVGWSLKSNGKRCVNACEEIHSEGHMKGVQALETPHLKDKDLHNGTSIMQRYLLSQNQNS